MRKGWPPGAGMRPWDPNHGQLSRLQDSDKVPKSISEKCSLMPISYEAHIRSRNKISCNPYPSLKCKMEVWGDQGSRKLHDWPRTARKTSWVTILFDGTLGERILLSAQSSLRWLAEETERCQEQIMSNDGMPQRAAQFVFSPWSQPSFYFLSSSYILYFNTLFVNCTKHCMFE